MANKFLNGDKITGISAMFISICTLFILIDEARIMRQQQELMRKQQLMSVFPYLDFSNYGTGGPNYKYILRNTGIGPAIVKSVKVYADGNTYDDIVYYLDDKFTEKDSVQYYYSNVSAGKMIPQGETVEMISIMGQKASSGIKIRQALSEIDVFIEIAYESVYKEEWIISNRASSPIKVCDTCTLDPQVFGYKSETVVIVPVTDHSYIHISYLETESFGKVACNGYIYVNDGEAIVFDTPLSNTGSEELIEWVASTLDAQIQAVVPGHFHEDCLGGLAAFHEAGIASYANQLTLKLAEEHGATIPQNGFEGKQTFDIGGSEVISAFLGEGHTRDNVVGYVPSEQILFGGCLIKSMDAGKGNLADANVAEWPNTVRRVQAEFPKIEAVIPGHGEPHSASLLDYTIELFEGE